MGKAHEKFTHNVHSESEAEVYIVLCENHIEKEVSCIFIFYKFLTNETAPANFDSKSGSLCTSLITD